MGYVRPPGGDAVYKDNINYSVADKLLFDIRRYARAIVALHVIFVSVVVITFGLVWHQVSRYQLIKAENINTLNTYVVSTMANAQQMSTLAVPIVANLQFVTGAIKAATAALANSTALTVPSPAPPSRRLLAPDAGADAAIQLTEQDLLAEDYKLRKMVYSQVHRLLQVSNDQMDAFNMSSLSDLLESISVQTRAVNFTGLASRYDRAMSDIEVTAHFGTVAASMMGVAAQSMNLTLPSPSQVLQNYMKQQQAAAAAAGVGGGACS